MSRPAVPPPHMETNQNNTLAEKLEMTGTLVDNLTEQLRMAGLVQRDFLPVRFPNTDHLKWAATFLPVEWVSGDIYDIARLDEQHIGFYVADVVGHAMPAALLTIFLKQTLIMRETIGNDYCIFPPAHVIQSLNARFTEQKLSGYQFATCCYCLLNMQTLQVTFARAGHPYPILIRPGQNPAQLEVPGPLLGIFDRSEYPEQTIQLQPGDKLLIYSDGAEPFIGAFDELTGFNYSDEFMSITNLPVDEMLNQFNILMKSRKLAPSEVDDITAVALEVS